MFRFASLVGAALLLSTPVALVASTSAEAIPVADPDTFRTPDGGAIKAAFLRRRGNLCFYRHGYHGPGYYPCRVGRRFLHPRLFVRGLRHRDRFEHARRDRGRIVRGGAGAARVGIARERFDRGGGRRFAPGRVGVRAGRPTDRAVVGPAGVAPRGAFRNGAGVGGGAARFSVTPGAGRAGGGVGPVGGARIGGGNAGIGAGGGIGRAGGAGIGGGGAGIGGAGRAGGGGIGGGGIGAGGGHAGGGGIGGGGMGGGGGHR